MENRTADSSPGLARFGMTRVRELTRSFRGGLDAGLEGEIRNDRNG
jgi:hypothetical protein